MWSGGYHQAMAWPEIETYRQLEQQYKQELEGYQHLDVAYREASASKAPETVLKQRYDQLADKRQELDKVYSRLTEMRSELARAREDASKTLLF